MNRWFDLPIEDGLPRPRLFEGDVYRVRDERGEIRLAKYERAPGGARGFYDEITDEPIYATAIEVGLSGGAACR